MTILFVMLVLRVTALPTRGSDPPTGAMATKSGVLHSPDFFPLAVWLQNPANAARYKIAGINLCVGLWRGPIEQQLALSHLPLYDARLSEGCRSPTNWRADMMST
jgi:hypothetical protein